MSKTYVPTWLRERVAAQARHRCGYCLTAEAVTGAPLVIDHLIPEALGGPTEEENLWLACSQCNLHKGDRVTVRDPLTEEWAPLFNPRRQIWAEHFRWTPTGDEVVGLTPVGRATVQALQLNRPLLVRARRAWVAVGWHPPPE
jgi:5-methylcytosine-specific restriction endonuclease McrA